MLPCWMERKKNWKNINHHHDLSSYFHFEETGDSDETADSDPIIGATTVDEDDDDNDDAQSCSYDESAGTCNAAEYDEEKNLEDDDEKKDVVYGTSYYDDGDADEMNEDQKSFDSGQVESLDEMEKNRMFWEACLAS